MERKTPHREGAGFLEEWTAGGQVLGGEDVLCLLLCLVGGVDDVCLELAGLLGDAVTELGCAPCQGGVAVGVYRCDGDGAEQGDVAQRVVAAG